MIVDDGQGRGYKAGVDSTNRLKTVSIAVPQQHHASVDHGKAFQVLGSVTIAGAGTYNVLQFVNDSDTDVVVGTYIRPAVAGLAGGTFGTATYFELDTGGIRSTGGTVVNAVNMNLTSGNVAPITAYAGNPTLTGTLIPFDFWYPEGATDNFSYNKEGTLILGKNDSVTFRFVTDHTSGVARIRVSFLMAEIGHHI